MRAALAAVCCVVLLAACGGDEEVDPEADQARADAAVLTIDELPAGFEETAADETDDDSADECLRGADLSADAVDEARTARATREFEGGEGMNVEAQVTVFESDDVPSTLIDLLDDDETLQCLSDAVQQQAESSDDELSITAVDIGQAPAIPEDLGEQRGAARMALTIEHSSGQTFDFQADIYAVRVDRATVTLTVTQLAGQALAEDDVNAALEAMTTRLEDGD